MLREASQGIFDTVRNRRLFRPADYVADRPVYIEDKGGRRCSQSRAPIYRDFDRAGPVLEALTSQTEAGCVDQARHGDPLSGLRG
jgi:hypothetical protein